MLDKRTCLAGLFRLAPIGREEGFMEGVSDGLFGAVAFHVSVFLRSGSFRGSVRLSQFLFARGALPHDRRSLVADPNGDAPVELCPPLKREGGHRHMTG